MFLVPCSFRIIFYKYQQWNALDVLAATGDHNGENGLWRQACGEFDSSGRVVFPYVGSMKNLESVRTIECRMRELAILAGCLLLLLCILPDYRLCGMITLLGIEHFSGCQC